MNTSAIVMAVISLSITWGGFAICLSLASRKKNNDISE